MITPEKVTPSIVEDQRAKPESENRQAKLPTLSSILEKIKRKLGLSANQPDQQNKNNPDQTTPAKKGLSRREFNSLFVGAGLATGAAMVVDRTGLTPETSSLASSDTTPTKSKNQAKENFSKNESPLDAPEFDELRRLAETDSLLAAVLEQISGVTLEQWQSYLEFMMSIYPEMPELSVEAQIVDDVHTRYLRNWSRADLDGQVLPDFYLATLQELNQLQISNLAVQEGSTELQKLQVLEAFYQAIDALSPDSAEKMQAVYMQLESAGLRILDLRLVGSDNRYQSLASVHMTFLPTNYAIRFDTFSSIGGFNTQEIMYAGLDQAGLENFINAVVNSGYGDTVLSYLQQNQE